MYIYTEMFNKWLNLKPMGWGSVNPSIYTWRKPIDD